MHFDQKRTYISIELSIGILDILIFILFTLDARDFGPLHVHIHVLRLGAMSGARYGARYGAGSGARSGAGSGAGHGAGPGAGSGAGYGARSGAGYRS